MAYIIQDDYSLRVGPSNLQEILDQAIVGTLGPLTQAQVRANAENWAMATITAYLVKQYDIATEFAKTNTDATRNYQVLVALIDLSLYTLHLTINPRDVPEHIEKAYEIAMKWLEDARDAKIVLALNPPQDDVEQGNTGDVHFPETFISGAVKFRSKPYQDANLFDREINPNTYDVPGSGANQNRQNAYITLGILNPGSGYQQGQFNIILTHLGGTNPTTPVYCSVLVQGGIVTQVTYQSGGLGADITSTFSYVGTLGGTGYGLQLSVLNLNNILNLPPYFYGY